MRQVLFWIPIRDIAAFLPDFPLIVYVAAAVLAVGLGSWLDKRRSEGAAQPRQGFKVLGSVLGALLLVAGVIVFFAPDTEWLPIYGYGTMLFVAFVACTWLASYLGSREGISPVHIQDMAIWIFLFGIIGARLTYMFFAEPDDFTWSFPTIIGQFFRVWDGGLVFYGSAVGGLIGYFFAQRFILRKHGIPTWKIADIVAPCAALGLALGRIGCLLNGCCYGDVAVCEGCPGLHFPLSSTPRFAMVARGHQTAAGFTLKDNDTIGAVEPDLPVNLRPGDKILQVNSKDVNALDPKRNEVQTVSYLFARDWPRGKNDLTLRVQHLSGGIEDVHYRPLTVGLHPTQLYESISMLLVFFLLLAYTPFRRQPGAVMVLFMFCYGIHRFLNEELRTDTPPVVFGLTLSQNLSILVLGFAVILALWLRIKTVRSRGGTPPPLAA